MQNKLSNDVEILLLVEGRFSHLRRADAVKRVAKIKGYTRSGVSGMCSRAKATHEGKSALMAYKQRNAPRVTPSRRDINRYIKEGRARLREHRAKLDAENEMRYAVFASDVHIPQADADAINLMLQVIDDINPVYISILNDALDFAPLSHWPGRKNLQLAMVEEDIAYIVETHNLYIDMLTEAAPEALLVPVTGNHDLRVANFSGEKGKALSVNEFMMSSLMATMHIKENVAFTSDMSKENMFLLNNRLAWMHGQTASSVPTSLMHKNHQYAMRHLRDMDEVERPLDLVWGHTHRPYDAIQHRHVNVRGWNAGCLCVTDSGSHEYLRHGNDWKQSFVVSLVDVSYEGTYHDTQNVYIQKNEDEAWCTFGGKRYSTQRIEAHIDSLLV